MLAVYYYNIVLLLKLLISFIDLFGDVVCDVDLFIAWFCLII